VIRNFWLYAIFFLNLPSSIQFNLESSVMSFANFLNRSMAQTDHSVVQQQYRCLEERMKLFELNMDSALKMIEQIRTAADQTSILLVKLRASASERSLYSQQVIDRLSLQLNDIRNSLQEIPLICFDEGIIGKLAQVKNDSTFIEEIQQTKHFNFLIN